MHVLADSCFASFTMDGPMITILPPQDGFDAVARQIRRRLIDVSTFNVIHASMGRADLDGFPVRNLVCAVQDFVETVRRFNSSALIVLVGPIPRQTDSHKMVGSCVNAGKLIRKFCAKNSDVVFSGLAMQFYNIKGIVPDMLQSTGATPLARLSLKKDIRQLFS